MNNEHSKRIACIFEKERVFLTKQGCFYGYENIEGTFKCYRLNNLEINRFLYRIKDNKEIMTLFTGKKIKKPLPRKYEEVNSLEA